MKKKTSLVVVLLMILSAVLSGCSGSALTAEEAMNMVDAELRAAYYGEFDKYEEIYGEKEEAEKIYEESVNESMNALKEEMGEVKDEATIRELALKIRNSIKFEVIDAVEEGDGSYTVHVDVSRLLMQEMIDEVASEDKIMEIFDALDDATKEELQDEQKASDWGYETIYGLVLKTLDNPSYGEVTTIDFSVKKVDGAWQVQAEGFEDFDEATSN